MLHAGCLPEIPLPRALALLIVLIFAWSAGTSPASAATIAVLMPGSAGAVPGDFLVRNEARINAAGIRTIVTTSPPSSSAGPTARRGSPGSTRKASRATTPATPAAHGFFRQDGPAISAVIGFIKSR